MIKQTHKLTLTLFASLPLLLASCDSGVEADSDAPDTPTEKRAMRFGTFVRPVTRALFDNDNIHSTPIRIYGEYSSKYHFETYGEYSWLNTFRNSESTGYEVFTHSSGEWSCPTTYYWEYGCTYRFRAVAPHSETLQTNSSITEITGIPVVQKFTPGNPESEVTDFLVAYATGDGDRPLNVVQIQFDHILSRFSAHAFTSAEGAPIALQSVSIWAPKSTLTATYEMDPDDKTNNTFTYDADFADASDEAAAPTGDYEEYPLSLPAENQSVPYAENLTAAQVEGGAVACLDELLIVPHDPLRLFASVTYTIAGDEFSAFVPLSGLDAIQTGKHYKLFIEFTTPDDFGPLRFTATTVQDWKGDDILN